MRVVRSPLLRPTIDSALAPYIVFSCITEAHWVKAPQRIDDVLCSRVLHGRIVVFIPSSYLMTRRAETTDHSDTDHVAGIFILRICTRVLRGAPTRYIFHPLSASIIVNNVRDTRLLTLSILLERCNLELWLPGNLFISLGPIFYVPKNFAKPF
ncbi:uncharacterized protein BDR25DRAFT_353946 [Lindgomyces ingoldianus]|uniref:Uncharacterized protein n=1 Tax=Lindgomyces ingoldianus TaxID=673940 RepID=A0ACB6QZH6_9PLEO|nr:uncharacterized protein BDR25DRAFT_353946 [Lindgomyces ingoldianus]KAF2472245.1 hypothetical protein BDR25DRAFT_353946 [Lindgomyces ingoldianus]